MPLSNTFHLPIVVQFVVTLMPRRILDAGVGMGVGGLLMRMHCDVNPGRLKKEDWQTRIEGIEIFEPYRNPIWDYAYDNVHMGDVRQILPTLPQFDLVTCLDVLEHFDRPAARELVQGLLAKAPVLIATTPNRDWPQGAVCGNEAEMHRSTLDASDFQNLVAEVRTGDTTCFVCCHDKRLVPILQRARWKMPAFRRRRWIDSAVKLRRFAKGHFRKRKSGKI
jgi:hypothetical protein